MNKNIVFIFLANLFLVSCKNEQRGKVNPDSRQLVKVDEKQVAIHDLVPVSGDTLIAAKWFGGILRTIDGGKNWIEIETPSIKYLSVDNKNRIWGINSWVGIHESSFSRMFYSDDYGDTWERFDFNVNYFFPLKFSKEFNPAVQIVTWDGLVLEYKGGLPNDLASWKKVMKRKNEEIGLNAKKAIADGNYRVFRNGLLEKKDFEGEWHKVLVVANISNPFDILVDSNRVYVAAGGYGGSKALFVEILNDSIPIERKMHSVQSLGVRKDNKARIWTFGDGGIFLMEGDHLKKMK